MVFGLLMMTIAVMASSQVVPAPAAAFSLIPLSQDLFFFNFK